MSKTTNKNSIYIVIPVYNEAIKVKEVVKDLKDKGFQNIVTVNDGSRDNSLDVLKGIKGIDVLDHTINRGQGAALKTGTDFALKKGAEYIVHFDSDGQHSSSEIMDLINSINENDLEMAVGSRFLNNNSNVPLSKRIVLRIGILVTLMISGILLTDTHNGFRAMKRSAAEKLKIELDRFEHASEILDIMKTQNINYREVPVTIEYTEYSKAKGQKISNSLRILWNVILYKLNKILF